MLNDFHEQTKQAKASIEDVANEVQTKIDALQARIDAANAESEALTAEYDEIILAGEADQAVDLKRRIEVQKDIAAALERQIAPLREEQANVRKDATERAAEAIAQLIEGEGNKIIEVKSQAAQKARDAYTCALKELEETQHAVAEQGRRIKHLCASSGATYRTPNVRRYNVSDFVVEEPAESQSAQSMF